MLIRYTVNFLRLILLELCNRVPYFYKIYSEVFRDKERSSLQLTLKWVQKTRDK